MNSFAERARRELLATGETVRKRTVETRGTHTAQEALIALLAAEGRINLEIGAQLFLSARTVAGTCARSSASSGSPPAASRGNGRDQHRSEHATRGSDDIATSTQRDCPCYCHPRHGPNSRLGSQPLSDLTITATISAGARCRTAEELIGSGGHIPWRKDSGNVLSDSSGSPGHTLGPVVQHRGPVSRPARRSPRSGGAFPNDRRHVVISRSGPPDFYQLVRTLGLDDQCECLP